MIPSAKVSSLLSLCLSHLLLGPAIAAPAGGSNQAPGPSTGQTTDSNWIVCGKQMPDRATATAYQDCLTALQAYKSNSRSYSWYDPFVHQGMAVMPGESLPQQEALGRCVVYVRFPNDRAPDRPVHLSPKEVYDAVVRIGQQCLVQSSSGSALGQIGSAKYGFLHLTLQVKEAPRAAAANDQVKPGCGFWGCWWGGSGRPTSTAPSAAAAAVGGMFGANIGAVGSSVCGTGGGGGGGGC